MARKALLAVILGILAFPARADELDAPPPPPHGPASVSLSLAEFDRYRKLDERASVTVVDVLKLGGSFRSRSLSISFSGRSSGRFPAETVLADEGLSVYGCSGEGIVSKGDEGFVLTPLAKKFEVRCRVAVRGSDRLELHLPKAVLWAESEISDGELVAGAVEDGGRSLSVVRRTSSPRETLPTGATGRYRITLSPDEARFSYVIEARNPNRTRQSLEVELRSGEHVLQVDAAVPYEVAGAGYTFELPPGDTRITLSGTLPGGTFTPPLEAAVQYVLLESHPLLLATVSGDLKRVSPAEVGLPAGFRGAQAFLLGEGESLTWGVTRMGALPTTSFAVRREAHVLFVASGGPSLGESAFALDNQGAPDVSVSASPEPTFAGLSGEPLLLTTARAGELHLPLGYGVQELALQHRQGLASTLGVAHGTLRLPRLAGPSSHASVEVRYPREWIPLLESFASETRLHLPGRGPLLLALLLFLLTERALGWLGVAARPRLLAAALSAVAGLAWRDAAWVLLLADAAVLALVLAVAVRRIRWTAARAGLAVAGFLGVVLALSITTSPGPASRRLRDVETPADGPAPQEGALKMHATRAADASAMAAPTASYQSGSAQGYQGLPARFELPAGAGRTFFAREMLSADGPRQVYVIAISRPLAVLFAAAAVLAAAWAWLHVRREAAAGLGARLTEAYGAFASPAAVAVP
jgi:hypothetical protein